MNESEYKTRMVKAINAEGHYARRFEDKFLVGFPDMMVMLRDIPKVFFIEGKVVDASTFAPRPRQYVELERLAFSGLGVPLIIGFWNDEVYLSPLTVRARVDQCAVKGGDESFSDFIARFHRSTNV